MSTQPQSSKKTLPSARAPKSRREEKTMYRTTVSLSPATAEAVESFKAATGLSTSRAIDELIARSVPRKPRIKMVNGLAVFDLPMKEGSISTEELLRLEDEAW